MIAAILRFIDRLAEGNPTSHRMPTCEGICNGTPLLKCHRKSARGSLDATMPAADLESMLISRMPKIVLQQYRPDSEPASRRRWVRSLGQSCRAHDVRETARM